MSRSLRIWGRKAFDRSNMCSLSQIGCWYVHQHTDKCRKQT